MNRFVFHKAAPAVFAAFAAAALSLAVGPEAAMAQQAAGGEDILLQLFPLVLIFVVFWFLLIRPQMKRAKEHAKMTQSLKRGDRILTGGGLYGEVVHAADDSDVVRVEISEGVEVKVARSTVSANITQAEAAAAAAVTKTPPSRKS